MNHFLIEHQCPQCGAPAVLEETDRLFTCEYCKVKSYLLQKDCMRYVLPNNAPKDKEIIFFPYWRFRGMFFSCHMNEVKHRFADVSQQALKSVHFPFSVGIRAQTMKLKFLSPETQGRFLKPDASVKEAIRIFENRFNPYRQSHYQAFIGETISLVYAPFYTHDNILYDAVLNKPVLPETNDQLGDGSTVRLTSQKSESAEVIPDISSLPKEHPDWRIQFVPALCPNCGWDLSGERDALALTCKNCNSAWHPGRSGFRRQKFVRIKGEGSFYLPFWRIQANVSGVILNSYADLARIANLPKAIQKDWEDMDFYFWTLAFKASPSRFLQLGCNMTLAQPRQEFTSELPNARLYPVTLPVTEAIESLKINLANLVKPKKNIVSRLSHIIIRPKRFMLVYVPFNETPHEFVHAEYNLTIHKNMLKMAGNL